MTLETERKRVGREPLRIVEVVLDFCDNTYGGGLLSPASGTCTAAIGTTGAQECFNTLETCQDTPNYVTTTGKTYRWCDDMPGLPPEVNAIPCITDVKMAPTRIEPGSGLGLRASVTMTLRDFPHHDRGMDLYVGNRAYTPEDQGTYFGKLRARNEHYMDRVLKVHTGYLEEDGTYDVANFETREYLLDRIDGPDAKGKVVIKALDPLKRIHGKKALCPVPTRGELTADLTDVATGSFTLTGESDWTKYPSAGYVRIGGEYIQYASRVDNGDGTWTASTLTRGRGGSTAEAHSTGDKAQRAKVFLAAYSADVAEELLTVDSETGHDLGGISASYITSADWTDEQDDWLLDMPLERWIGEPTSIEELLKDLTIETSTYLWWDAPASKIRFKAVAPVWGPLPTVTDGANILRNTGVVKEQHDERLTEVWAAWGRANWAKDADEFTNYLQVEVEIDADAESATGYGDQRIEIIYCQWLSTGAAVIALTQRLMEARRKTPRRITVHLDPKDTLETADPFTFVSDILQDGTGAALAVKLQVLSVQEIPDGRVIEAASWPYVRERYARYMDATPDDYATATETEREEGAFYADDNDQITDDHSEAYRYV